MNLLHSLKQARLTFQHDNDCYKSKMEAVFCQLKHTLTADAVHYCRSKISISLQTHSLLSESNTCLTIHSKCTNSNEQSNLSICDHLRVLVIILPITATGRSIQMNVLKMSNAQMENVNQTCVCYFPTRTLITTF